MIHTIRYYTKCLIRSFAYLKQGWNSEDYDYGYLLKDMIFKSKRLKLEIVNGSSLEREVTGEEIERFINALEAVSQNDYFEILLQKEHTPIYGELEWRSEPASSGYSQFITDWPNARTGTESYERASEHFMALHKKAEELRNSDLHKIGSVFSYKKILRWWD